MIINILFVSENILLFIFGLFITAVSMIFCYAGYHSMFIVLGSNNLNVIHKSICLKDITTYKPWELERIDFTYSAVEGNKTSHIYDLKVVKKNGNTESILYLNSKSIRFTQDEMEYFLYTVNTHIQTKMRVTKKY